MSISILLHAFAGAGHCHYRFTLLTCCTSVQSPLHAQISWLFLMMGLFRCNKSKRSTTPVGAPSLEQLQVKAVRFRHCDLLQQHCPVTLLVSSVCKTKEAALSCVCCPAATVSDQGYETPKEWRTAANTSPAASLPAWGLL